MEFPTSVHQQKETSSSMVSVFSAVQTKKRGVSIIQLSLVGGFNPSEKY